MPFPFESADTTFPRAEILLLMFLASKSLYPFEPDFETLSDPARSTIVISDFQWCHFLMNYFSPRSSSSSIFSIYLVSMNICNIAWDHDDVSFIVVELVDLNYAPFHMIYNNSSFLLIVYLVNPCTNIPLQGSSQICKF